VTVFWYWNELSPPRVRQSVKGVRPGQAVNPSARGRVSDISNVRTGGGKNQALPGGVHAPGKAGSVVPSYEDPMTVGRYPGFMARPSIG
jgi:hypothetical protein